MSLPILEQIAVALKALLEGITTAAGYNIDVVKVIRPTKADPAKNLADYCIVLQQDDPEEAENTPHMMKRWSQPFLIDCIHRPSEESTVPVEKVLNTFRADVEKALRADPSLGGLALDSIIRPPQGFTSANGEYEGVRVNVDVLYQTIEDNPYSST